MIALFYLILAALPLLLWHAVGNPVTATDAYLRDDQLQLLWNTLLTDPTGDTPAFVQAAIDLLWIAWTPFALAAALLLAAIALRIPRTAIPLFLLRLTPLTVVHATALGAAAVAHAQTVAVHATALTHDEHARADLATGMHTVVEPGDTLWSIAEHAYGRSQDWPAIYTANEHHPQPGDETLTEPNLIRPGWTLTIPGNTDGAPTPATTTPAPARPPATATKPATPPPTAPTVPRGTVPAPTAHNAAPNGGNGPTRPAAVPDHNAAPTHSDTPWTTRIRLPSGGYIGITLLMAVAGAAVALRRRAHRTGPTTGLPETARHLVITAGRAEMASTGAWDPDLETDPTPPPLLRPRPEHLIFGTTSTGEDEAVLHPQRHPLTAYTGPGAHEAAAALALSALSSQPEHRLITTEALAQTLLGIDADRVDPAWITLTLDTPGTLRAATEVAQVLEQPAILVIAEAAAARTFQITAALAADRGHNRLAVLLLGDVAHLAALGPTTIDLDHDGRPRTCTGPQAAAFHNARFHTLPPVDAHDLYRVLHHYRANQPTPRLPAQTRDEREAHPTSPHPEQDPADDEPHPTPDNPATATDSVTTADTGPLLLRVLGPLTFENTAGQTLPGPSGRTAQLLTYLALHPRGRTLPQITAAIWNTNNPSGANSTLVRARKDLHAAITELTPELLAGNDQAPQPIVLEPHGAYRLNPQLIKTDRDAFERLESAVRREKDSARSTTLAAEAFAHLRGELAEGVSDSGQDWLMEARADLDDRHSGLLHTADRHGSGPPPYVPAPPPGASSQQYAR